MDDLDLDLLISELAEEGDPVSFGPEDPFEWRAKPIMVLLAKKIRTLEDENLQRKAAQAALEPLVKWGGSLIGAVATAAVLMNLGLG